MAHPVPNGGSVTWLKRLWIPKVYLLLEHYPEEFRQDFKPYCFIDLNIDEDLNYDCVSQL
jgi:hypothetical protein